MSKKGYRKLKDRLYREIKRRITAEGQIGAYRKRAELSEEDAEYYKKRFREFGSNVETIEPDDSGTVNMVKYELKPGPWGQYIVLKNEEFSQSIPEEIYTKYKWELLENLVDNLIERNIAQIYFRQFSNDHPLYEFGTLGVKLFVIPWEKLPRRESLDQAIFIQSVTERKEKGR